MTKDEMNKAVWEWLGHCWHEYPPKDTVKERKCIYCGVHVADKTSPYRSNNPDFTTDSGAVMLLRELMKREDWPKLAYYYNLVDGCQTVIPIWWVTTPDKLLDAVVEWIEKGEV